MKYLIVALALSGCALSPEQINAASKAKDANVVCVHAEGLWGKATTTYMNVDKGVVDLGGVQIAPDCAVAFANRKGL
jgi:hypothetical protein